jgi:hypothetical protein
MRPDVAEIQRRTPVTQALVRSLLNGRPALAYEDNYRAYRWRCFELGHPWLTRIAAFFALGWRFALAR